MLSFDMAAAPGRTYRFYRGPPAQWAFGHGLSYADLMLSAYADHKNASVVVACVRNADARRAADAVVLAFIEPRPGTVPASAPASHLVRQLVTFERLGPIAATASARVKITLSSAMATFHDAAGLPTLYPGQYALRLSTAGEALAVTLPLTCSKDACQVDVSA